MGNRNGQSEISSSKDAIEPGFWLKKFRSQTMSISVHQPIDMLYQLMAIASIAPTV